MDVREKQLLDYLVNPRNYFDVVIDYDVDYDEYVCTLGFSNGDACSQYKIDSVADIGNVLRDWLIENEADYLAPKVKNGA